MTGRFRLLWLLICMQSGPPPGREFDFVSYNNGPYEDGFGASGCVIGLLPLYFPQQWEYRLVTDFCGVDRYYPYLQSSCHQDLETDVLEFFQMSEADFNYLFVPGESGLTEETSWEEFELHLRRYLGLDETWAVPVLAEYGKEVAA